VVEGFEWLDSAPGTMAFRRQGVTVMVNYGPDPVPIPAGEVLVASQDLDGDVLPIDTTVWVEG